MKESLTTMDMMLHPVGYVRSPYKKRGDAPRQGRLSGKTAEIVIDPQYRDGLFRLKGEKHLIVLAWFDRSDRTFLRVTPPGTMVEHGVFATRSPDRPNPIGLSVVDLIGIKDGVLEVRGLDSLDGTPIIDIKPYIPEFDCPPPAE
ncbi:MAG: tRNA (N6-threonylcarbamoyladenosine(37)-N6)-methyltransferase TrmO [Methanoregula sp.]|nr:tRNA (N6-threonylcarbamoyladenosine(37)-N6)-methyltransferase TrmO [Methanoregula sp.]